MDAKNEAGKMRFYVPFFLAFMVFSAVLATEYLIVADMLEESYQYQSEYYHTVVQSINAGYEYYHGDSVSIPGDVNSFLDFLRDNSGINGLSVRIAGNPEELAAYMYSSLNGRNLLEGVDIENRVIETSIAKTTDGKYLILEAINHNNSQIKYMQDLSVALIIISIVMIIIAIVPGVLMIESLTRRKQMAGSILSSSGMETWKVLKDVFGPSGVVGCMVVSSGRLVLWANETCREMLEMTGEGAGIPLASVTSLPEKIRHCEPPYSTVPAREMVRIRSMFGETRSLMMELLPQTVAGVVQHRIFTFTRPNTEVSVSSDGKAARPGDNLDSGSPAAFQLAESIVHDMNNHLSGIIGLVSVEMEKTGREEEKGCARILDSAEKMSTLCQDLQSLLTGEEESALRDALEEMNLISEVMRRILPEGVTFRVTGKCEKLVAVKREHLRELLYNLSLNSTGMMNGEGRIRIDVSEKIPFGGSHIESVSPGNRVCIRYSDGYIMPVALRDVLSGRKYSVSDVERKFGITIGALYKALREIDGKIVFERGSGETVLCIVLEGYEKPWLNDDNTPYHSVHSDVTGLSVLVADEVEIVLLSTCEYLEHRGMVTTAVSDGDTAMKLLRTKKFDATVLDLNMPGIPTASIVRYCHTTLPSMAVVITTGYGDSDYVRELIKVPSVDCLYKPHRPEMLVESIYSTLMRIQEEEHR